VRHDAAVKKRVSILERPVYGVSEAYGLTERAHGWTATSVVASLTRRS
jgi:hypothetical protein